ncbi:MAG: hypothetical protein DRH30_14310 [Deltaproteobacteria bacterium]|nr:MAG: hypothetical protein DRH30_14310 [Deltaproteobacteria bacterium]
MAIEKTAFPARARVMEMPGEDVMDCERRGRWQYVSVRWVEGRIERRTQLYLHVDCDALTGLRDGHCVMCGAPSPAAADWMTGKTDWSC